MSDEALTALAARHAMRVTGPVPGGYVRSRIGAATGSCQTAATGLYAGRRPHVMASRTAGSID